MFVNSRLIVFFAIFGMFSATEIAYATPPLLTVDVTPNALGSFTGSIAVGATGTAAELNWHDAGYTWNGNIELTNSSGDALVNIVTNSDLYNLYAIGSGNSAIGTPCVSSNSTGCVSIAYNQPISLRSTINSLNGGHGICCSLSSDLLVTYFSQASNIDSTQLSYLASGLGSTVNPAFQGGTLQTDQNNGVYAQNFTLDNSGANVIDQSGNNSTFSGVFSDAVTGQPGTIAIENSGVGGSVTLSGVNTYTGSTSIGSDSTLALSGNGSVADSNGLNLIGNGATLDISNTNAGASLNNLFGVSGSLVNLGAETLTDQGVSNFSGQINGTGGLALSGNGTALTLSGSNTYSGGTLVNNGSTLYLATGGSIVGPVVDNGSVSFNKADNATFSGSFSGNGNLIQSGTGTLVLNGDSSAFAGSTAVNSGTLEVGDSSNPGAVLGGNVAVDNGAMLRGHGTIGGNLVNNGAVYPGGSIGILTVSGNYIQNAGSTLNIEVTPVAVAGVGYDQLNVTGSASLAGALAINVDSGTYALNSKYDIVHTTGGVSGKFDTTSYNPAFAAYIDPVISYQANDVFLNLIPTSNAFSTGRIYVANNFIQDQSLLSTMDAGLDSVALSGPNKQSVWIEGVGGFGSNSGFESNYKGFIVGNGYAISPKMTLGGALSSISTSTSNSHSNVQSSSIGIYGYGVYDRGYENRMQISAIAGVGHIDTNTDRGLPSLGISGKSNSDGVYADTGLKVNYTFGGPKGFLVPYASAKYLYTSLGHSQETGANLLNLHYSATNTSLGELAVGTTAGIDFQKKYGTLVPWMQLGAIASVGNTRIANTETLSGLSGEETAIATPSGGLTAGVGIDMIGRGPWKLSAAWKGQYGGNTSIENLTLEGRYIW